MLWCFTVISCSGGKNGDIIGQYEGVGDYEPLSLSIEKDGEGIEIITLSDVDVTVTVPFTWTMNGNNVLHLDFDPDNAAISGVGEDQELQAIVFTLLSTYTEPRIYILDRTKHPLELRCGEDCPRYRKMSD